MYLLQNMCALEPPEIMLRKVVVTIQKENAECRITIQLQFEAKRKILRVVHGV